jgi:ATP-dependent Lon protease
LRGRVLPIGGIKEKLMAAHRNRMTTVLIPRRNQKDLVDVPRDVQRELKILMVDRMDEILSSALLPGPERAPKPKRTRARKQKTEGQPADGQAVVPPAPAAPAN